MLVTGLLAAGSTTTAMACIAMAATLLRHPDTLERIRGDRSLIPAAVEEVLRFSFGGPAGLPRYAVRDFTLRGQQIRKGEMLMLSFGGANRDPEVFENPDVFDIDRDARELMVFGGGAHYCLGANLARQELTCMLDGLLDILTPGSKMSGDARRPQGLILLGGGEFAIEIA